LELTTADCSLQYNTFAYLHCEAETKTAE